MLNENCIFPLTFEKVSIIVNYNYRPFRDHHWCLLQWDSLFMCSNVGLYRTLTSKNILIHLSQNTDPDSLF